PSAYGGLFRSRDFGGTWLNADVGLFLGGAVSVAINPGEPNHLLLGTDNNLLVSRTGGRDWKQESPDKLFGAVTAVAFLPGGRVTLCSTPAGVFRFEEGKWQSASAPNEAAPARAIVPGAEPGRVYLVGRRDLFRSDDDGRQWRRVEHVLPGAPEFVELVAAFAPAETLYAVVDGKLLASVDRGQNWASRHNGLPEEGVEALTLDPAAQGRLWVAGADRLYVSDDGGIRWRAVGEPLPEAGTSVRAIAADASGQKIVVATHRGMYRSIDAGNSWGLLEGNLPVHLEAKPLLRDASHTHTLYAGYSLMPYSEIWRIALEGGNLLDRVNLLSLAGGLAFLVLLILLGVLAARWLSRRSANPELPIQ
ncbi:MAG: WD40/YVTN/BNR-like repeat-containing protein, partial [Burkholderiales bacterium]